MNASQAKGELRKLIAKADAAEKHRVSRLSPRQRQMEAAMCFARLGVDRAVEEGNPVGVSTAQKVLEAITVGDRWWIEFANDVLTKWALEAEFKRLDGEPAIVALHPQPIRHMRQRLDAAQARLNVKLDELRAEADRRGLQVA